MEARTRRLTLAMIVVTLLWTGLWSAQARSGFPAIQNEQTVWDGVYSRAQAERGRVLFDAECSRCHGVMDFVGDDYMATWEGQTLRDFYLYVSSGMPPDQHEPIEDFLAYAELVAYLLQANALPPGQTDLTANLDRLDRIRIEGMN